MIRPLSDTPPPYDVCIIGAGPAGLTVASQLAYSDLRVCVLESGDTARSPFADALKDVEFEGLPIKDNSRERIVGGSSATWDALSAPLDEVDFERRGWPEWPIGADDLQPYLGQAVAYRFPDPSEFAAPRATAGDHGWGPWRDLAVKMFVAVKPPYRFGALKEIFHRPTLDLWTNATVTRLESKSAPDGQRTVTAAVCRAREGAEVRVAAARFVLAAGGIENARLLLNSPGCGAGGTLGNEHDQVGRWFMNHPKGTAGLLHLSTALPPDSSYVDRTIGSRLSYAGLRLAPDLQRRTGLLNSCVGFQPHVRVGGGLAGRVDRLRQRAHGSTRLGRIAPAFGRSWDRLRPRLRTLALRWFAEMEPRAGNRITLADRCDAFGTPLPHVSHEFSDRDRETLIALHDALQANVARLGLGRLESTADEVLAEVRLDASHHLGSTRMGADPRTSVVDPDCRVHTVSNLYAAGGSVFASGGCANPTLTIVALAIRLASHLSKMGKPAAVRVSAAPSATAVRVVLVGAGARVGADVVPALEACAGRFSIGGIHARNRASVFGRVRRYDVEPLGALTREALARARFVYVGVPPSAVIPVLESLQPASDIQLILDTPVPLSRTAMALLRRFKRVHVAEDSVYLPWLEAVRLFWTTHKLDGPVDIRCDRSAFQYHAVALAKALCGTAGRPDTVLAAERAGGRLLVRLAHGTATIIEPRDYATGRLRITRGGVTLASHPDGRDVPIRLLHTDGLCTGVEVGGATAMLTSAESSLLGGVVAQDSIVSRMPEFKRVGLARLLTLIADGREPWPLEQGLDDARVDCTGR